ncbi:MAG TPA: tetratricopeptide repeat protein [Lacunisphaera sp.]
MLRLRFLLLPALAAWPAFAAENALRDQVAELFKHRQWAEAQTLLEDVTTKEPANAEAWSSLGQVYLARGDQDKAVAAAEKATGLDGTKSDYFLQLGNAYGLAAMKAGPLGKVGFAKKCKGAYDKAVELDPNNINARWSVMEYCRQAPGFLGGGMADAYAQAAEIKRLDARRGRAAYASLYSAEKKYAEAFALYDEVLKEKPDDDDALFQIGRLAARSGEQLDRGLTALHQLVAREGRPADARTHTLIGNILERKGDKPGARTAYETAIAIDPKSIQAIESLKKL